MSAPGNRRVSTGRPPHSSAVGPLIGPVSPLKTGVEAMK
jgi:hypothetical protein